MTLIPAHLRLITAAEYRGRKWSDTATPLLSSTVTRKAFGASNRVAPHRAAFEFYPTPPEATLALLSVERFEGAIWEPACGQGHISKVIETAGHTVVSTDLARCWNYGQGGRDFLCSFPKSGPHRFSDKKLHQQENLSSVCW